MKNIDLLEHGGAGGQRFAILLDGYLIEMPDPRDRNYQWVLMALRLEHVPWTPGDLPEWKRQAVFGRWAAAWDLPDFTSAQRLAYLVDNYRAALSSDLLTYAGADLGALWRERRWTRLLDLIDRLPGHSHYSATVANDEEHARLVAESLAGNPQAEAAEDRGPALTGWTPEVAAITRLTDAVNSVRYAVVASQLGSKKAGEPPKPERRPVTAIQKAIKRAEFARKRAAHEALVARVLPHKAAVKS